MTEATTESRVRARANRLGYGVCKSRQSLHYNNCGGYMLFDRNTNTVIDGIRFELTIDEVAQRLKEIAQGRAA